MKLHSLRNHPLLTGTLLLTLTGLLSRVIGFFYRIFLSQTIGAEGMGIYQLTVPIHILTISLTSSAIQTAISRFVAQAAIASNTENNPSDRKTPCNEKCYFSAGLILSLLLAFLCSFFLYHFSDWIAINFLEEKRCAPLLKILTLSIPFGAIHACISGYFYGLKKTFVPATSQLIEQIVRVASVWLFFEISMEKYNAISISLVVWGMVAGEVASALFSISFLSGKGCAMTLPRAERGRLRHRSSSRECASSGRFLSYRKQCFLYDKKSRGSRLLAINQIFVMSFPLTANRVLVNILQSMEAVMIPGQLRLYGYSASESLSVYGILTGMALPMVLFPSVLTNSVSVMLLPAIAEAQEKKDRSYIINAVRKTCFFSLLLGFGCTTLFLLLGNWMGITLFGNELAGTFIVILGWICPFLYLTTTLHSILNGLGKTTSTFLLNVIGLGIRIGFVLFVIPIAGIKGYLWGLLASQAIMAGGALPMLLKSRS